MSAKVWATRRNDASAGLPSSRLHAMETSCDRKCVSSERGRYATLGCINEIRLLGITATDSPAATRQITPPTCAHSCSILGEKPAVAQAEINCACAVGTFSFEKDTNDSCAN